jgi:hypothetical protein
MMNPHIKQVDMNPSKLWETFFGDEWPFVHSALTSLMLVPESSFKDILDRISRVISVGPILNPSGCMTPGWFENADAWHKLFSAALTLRRLLPEMRPVSSLTPQEAASDSRTSV